MTVRIVGGYEYSESWRSFQVHECAADVHKCIENGCLNETGLCQNCLSENLEALNPTPVVFRFFSSIH